MKSVSNPPRLLSLPVLPSRPQYPTDKYINIAYSYTVSLYDNSRFFHKLLRGFTLGLEESFVLFSFFRP